jgi:hypothetical protein
MNKRRLHHYWTKLRSVSPWYFLVLFVVSAALSVYALRSNNLRMIELRDAVVAADERGGDTEAALRDLREFVHSHMNTDLASGRNAIRPPVQLKFRYERLVAEEKKRVAASNAQIYTRAQEICEQRFPAGLSGGRRVPCIEQYVTQNGVREQSIPESLYKFDFVSPYWSPDLAGWSIVASGLFLLLGVSRFGMERWIKSEL